MAGIYGVLLKKNRIINLYKKFYNHSFKNILQEEKKINNFLFGRSVLNKFTDDRFLFEDDNFIVCFEGINYSSIITPQDFINAFRKEGKRFIQNLKGNFSGFLFDKNTEQLIVYNDPLATKSIYYYYDKEFGFAFSSEMHVLSKLLRENNIPINYDYDGIYSLALYGQMFNNFTLVKEIKRLDYASILTYRLKEDTIHTKSYFRFSKNENRQSLTDIIEEIDRIMLISVKEEWDKDLSNGYQKHLTLISGGMDSRVNSLLAKSLKFKNIDSYTYGNPESSDVRIAKEIAQENFISHTQYNLLNGKFFTENILENYVKATDGLTHFTANAIIYNALKRYNCQDYGLLHSGQIGGMPFGSYTKKNYDFLANKDKIGITGFLPNKKISEKLNFLDDLIEQYRGKDYEIFAYEQRQINGTLSGDKVFNNFIDQVSPFFNLDLLKISLSIPDKYKIRQQLYFEWLSKKHPDILDYKWEKIGLKPNSSINFKYGRYLKKYTNGAKKYFKLKYDSMNPITNWFQNDSSIEKKFDEIFYENLELIEDQELKEDIISIYKGYIFEHRNKFAVISVLLAIKLHFYS